MLMMLTLMMLVDDASRMIGLDWAGLIGWIALIELIDLI